MLKGFVKSAAQHDCNAASTAAVCLAMHVVHVCVHVARHVVVLAGPTARLGLAVTGVAS